MQRGRKSAKRSADRLSVSPSPKRQKVDKDATAPLSNDQVADNWKLVNGYMLWLNQMYNGRDIAPETVSKMLSQPLHKFINKINFEEVTNVWCDSQLLFDRIKRKYWASGITIHKAIADFPPKIGNIAYKSSSLMDGGGSSSESSAESGSDDSSNSSSSESDYPGIYAYTIKVVHAKCCRVEKIIGYTREESEQYSRILGLEGTRVDEDDKFVRGWIINPRWVNVCSEFRANR